MDKDIVKQIVAALASIVENETASWTFPGGVVTINHLPRTGPRISLDAQGILCSWGIVSLRVPVGTEGYDHFAPLLQGQKTLLDSKISLQLNPRQPLGVWEQSVPFKLRLHLTDTHVSDGGPIDGDVDGVTVTKDKIVVHLSKWGMDRLVKDRVYDIESGDSHDA